MGELAAELLHPAPGVAVLALHGRGGALDVDDLRESVRIAGSGRRALVIDLERAETDEPAIVEVLLDATRAGQVEGRAVEVVLPPRSPLADILRTSGLAGGLRLHATRAEALAAAAAR